MHLDTLRVDAAHDVADGAVLAGRVHGLQDDDHAVGVLGRESGLVLGQQLDARGQGFLLLGLGGLGRDLGRVEVARQADPASRLHPERLDELVDALGCDRRHCRPSISWSLRLSGR